MNILTIGGSDPSSGAGIQSDVKTFYSLNVYGLSVVTAITSQNTKKFSKVESISPRMIHEQIDSIFSDFDIDAIKIGMVYNSSIIKAVFSKLKDIKIPIIVDPIIQSTTKGTILENKALKDFKKFIIPLSYIITPNISEAEKISGVKISSKKDLEKSAVKIKNIGANNVIITGFEYENKIIDFVLEESQKYFLSGKKLQIFNHGSGCNFSASLASAIAMGKTIHESVKFAKTYTYNSIKNAQKIGKGLSISNQRKKSKMEQELSDAIVDLRAIKKFHSVIPECQTNFVYAKTKPRKRSEVLGISGRLIKSGKNVLMAGNIEFGGSKHVANAVIQISKKIPEIRSALNIKYSDSIISKCKKNNFVTLHYDRKKEPIKIKNNENSSISWGIKKALKNSHLIPDVIYHKGDFGKEPMIIIFGKNPNDVIDKVSSII